MARLQIPSLLCLVLALNGQTQRSISIHKPPISCIFSPSAGTFAIYVQLCTYILYFRYIRRDCVKYPRKCASALSITLSRQLFGSRSFPGARQFRYGFVIL